MGLEYIPPNLLTYGTSTHHFLRTKRVPAQYYTYLSSLKSTTPKPENSTLHLKIVNHRVLAVPPASSGGMRRLAPRL